MKTSTKKGFTLIELLVVIAIIGILSAVVLASLNTARLKSRDAKRVADIKQIQVALELYFDDNTSYPTVLEGNLNPTYIPVIPVDPLSKVDAVVNYDYSGLVGSGTSCTSYHLRALLEGATHATLLNDSDATASTVCAGSAADVDGIDPIYDVTP